ncbi:hypothetical protein BaOVIS_018040 [Babesia ovis]|uniref:Uncharacterized protein n=1 Tax=Babesia ovis TaxID=5869 RepID=A0A9W5TAH1_BABOV|nr:hypothetical protein BaOVIS_018040 [Babesia ovis]
MFADEMRQRVEEVMTNAKTDESQYRDRCNQGMEDEGPLPLLYLNSRSEALFPDERITVTLNKVDAARLMQFVSSRNGRILIVCEKSGPGKQFGAMADITESNIPDDLSDPFIMATIQTVVVERVEIVGTESETPYSWTTSCYRILHDDFIFPETDEQNHLEELEQLQQAIATKCVGQDSLIPEFKALENIIEKDTTPMDRYVICCQLVQLCSVIAKHQLQYSSLEGQRHFEGNFSQLAIVGDKPTSGELEYASMYYARLVIAKRKDKLRWYYMKDTFERLVEVTKIYVYAGDKFILQFQLVSPAGRQAAPSLLQSFKSRSSSERIPSSRPRAAQNDGLSSNATAYSSLQTGAQVDGAKDTTWRRMPRGRSRSYRFSHLLNLLPRLYMYPVFLAILPIACGHPRSMMPADMEQHAFVALSCLSFGSVFAGAMISAGLITEPCLSCSMAPYFEPTNFTPELVAKCPFNGYNCFSGCPVNITGGPSEKLQLQNQHLSNLEVVFWTEQFLQAICTPPL